jgi:hypothetical protein
LPLQISTEPTFLGKKLLCNLDVPDIEKNPCPKRGLAKFNKITAIFFRFQLIVKNAIVAQIILLQTGMIMSRYLFIFWLKNPAAFNGDFWCQFINIWILIVSVLPQAIMYFLSGSSPLMFCICSGTKPTFDLKNPPPINFPILLLGLFCVMSYLVLGGRILLFKNKLSAEKTCTSKNSFLKSLETQSLSDFTSSTLEIIGAGSAALLYFKIKDVTPEQLNFYPNYMFIYLIHLVNGPLTCIVVIALCYSRNKAMRKVIIREAKELLRISND